MRTHSMRCGLAVLTIVAMSGCYSNGQWTMPWKSSSPFQASNTPISAVPGTSGTQKKPAGIALNNANSSVAPSYEKGTLMAGNNSATGTLPSGYPSTPQYPQYPTTTPAAGYAANTGYGAPSNPPAYVASNTGSPSYGVTTNPSTATRNPSPATPVGSAYGGYAAAPSSGYPTTTSPSSATGGYPTTNPPVSNPTNIAPTAGYPTSGYSTGSKPPTSYANPIRPSSAPASEPNRYGALPPASSTGSSMPSATRASFDSPGTSAVPAAYQPGSARTYPTTPNTTATPAPTTTSPSGVTQTGYMPTTSSPAAAVPATGAYPAASAPTYVPASSGAPAYPTTSAPAYPSTGYGN